MTKVYKNDVGTEIILDCGQDISSSTTRKIKVKKPDNTLVEWTASLEGTTKIKYTTQSGDLALAGKYLMQAYVSIGSWSGSGETCALVVYDSFK